MAGLQDLLEAYKNYRGVQDWKFGQQMNRVPGAEEAMNLFGGFDTGGLAGAIKTYHMTPYDFEKFDLSKAKKGLGGMMHGRGIYTTDNPEGATDWIEQLPEKLQSKAKVLDVDLQWPDPAKEAATPLSPEDYLNYYERVQDLPEGIKNSILDLVKTKKLPYEFVGPLISKLKLEQELAKRGIPGVKVPYGTEADYITFDPSYTKINK